MERDSMSYIIRKIKCFLFVINLYPIKNYFQVSVLILLSLIAILIPFVFTAIACRLLIYSINLDETNVFYNILSHYANKALLGGLSIVIPIGVLMYVALLIELLCKK
jgi:hypothetical protein